MFRVRRKEAPKEAEGTTYEAGAFSVTFETHRLEFYQITFEITTSFS